MFILATADACGDVALANILSLTQTAFDIICIAVPIILIISLALTLFKVVTDPDQKHFVRKIISQIAAAIIVFLLPTIVNIVMAWLPSGGMNIADCWQAAREAKGELGIILPVDEINM
ncbi:MAG TPA: hypothetical protein IAB59_06775 [Candidatus Onthousia faecipullorum]|uniref:Uncharacterized protein n=1 Tax=Candidatus Onthousia faecipullorum TaxID=2840887 RepID=A0A9D1GDB5_9FIRM|nr:hypothetical protein [Candidatus Onthousia faecipullorum]